MPEEFEKFLDRFVGKEGEESLNKAGEVIFQLRKAAEMAESAVSHLSAARAAMVSGYEKTKSFFGEETLGKVKEFYSRLRKLGIISLLERKE